MAFTVHYPGDRPIRYDDQASYKILDNAVLEITDPENNKTFRISPTSWLWVEERLDLNKGAVYIV